MAILLILLSFSLLTTIFVWIILYVGDSMAEIEEEILSRKEGEP